MVTKIPATSTTLAPLLRLCDTTSSCRGFAGSDALDKEQELWAGNSNLHSTGTQQMTLRDLQQGTSYWVQARGRNKDQLGSYCSTIHVATSSLALHVPQSPQTSMLVTVSPSKWIMWFGVAVGALVAAAGLCYSFRWYVRMIRFRNMKYRVVHEHKKWVQTAMKKRKRAGLHVEGHEVQELLSNTEDQEDEELAALEHTSRLFPS